MAIPKKGSRLITIDDMTFRWRVRRKPTCRQGNSWGPMTFVVELPGVSGRVLLVSLPCSWRTRGGANGQWPYGRR